MVNRRRSIRLPEFDYAQAGAYFVTMCACKRASLFGAIRSGEMLLNEYGQIVAEEWLRTPAIRPEVELDAFVVMPNHLHGIVVFHDVGAHGGAPLQEQPRLFRPPKSLGSLIAGFKSVATKRINSLRNMPATPVWQRNYYEHIIRNEQDWQKIRDYIETNPTHWERDDENLSGSPLAVSL